MAYDAAKDVLVAKVGELVEGPNTRLEFAVYQYNGGAKKLRVTRITQGKTTYRDSVAKLDRDDFAALLGLSDKILAVL